LKYSNTEERRNFLKQSGILLGISLTSIVLPGLLSSCSNSTSPTNNSTNPIKLADYPALLNVNGSVKITISGKNGGKPMIVLRESPSQFSVLSTVCKHQGCEVDLPDSSKVIHCPCHGSQYSADDGAVLQGPTTQPLDKLNWSFDSANNLLTIN
jgi:cytochrome b6-f complex iron-sulfur subunit